MPAACAAPAPAFWPKTCVANPVYGDMASPATCRSCCCGLPIASKIDLVRQLIHAHAYWRFKGLPVDLVIWNEDQSGYRQLLQDEIVSLIAGSTEAHVLDRPGGIFVRRPEQMSDEDRILMQSVARVVLTDSGGMLADQIERRGRREISMPAFVPMRGRKAEPIPSPRLPFRELIYANGLGGFTPDGREYVITTSTFATNAGPVGQRVGQSSVRHGGNAKAAADIPGSKTPTSFG